jgi:hypothetical protein
MTKRKRSVKKSTLKQAKKRFIRFVLTVGFITIVAVSSYGIWSARNILKPISTQASSESTFTVETNEKQYSFFAINSNEKELVTSGHLIMVDTEEHVVKELILPAETMLHLPYGLNEFKLQSLYKMAHLEKPQSPLQLMDATLTGYFGVATKNILITKRNDDTASFFDWISTPTTLFNLVFNEDWTRNHITATQSRLELVSIAKDILSVQTQSRDSTTIVEYGIGSEHKDIDGSKTVVTDTNKLDTYIKKTFENTSISEEKANITIENSAEVTGLASQVGRVLTNMGGIVVELKNGETPQETSTVELNDQKWLKSKTLQKILKAIPTAKISQTLSTDKKADITVTLGKDYAKLIYGNAVTQE